LRPFGSGITEFPYPNPGYLTPGIDDIPAAAAATKLDLFSETESIALASEIGLRLVLDDLKARKVAENLGLSEKLIAILLERRAS